MQLLHLTYRWPSNDGPTELRIKEAHESWLTGSDPQIYKPIHLQPGDVNFTSQDLGDQQPYPILKCIIDQAFNEREDDNSMLLFVNTDIGLNAEHWPQVERFIQFEITSYEDCEHTRPRRPGEAKSTPVTFFLSYKWWNENKIFIPPVLFACPYWERPYQIVIDKTTPPMPPTPQTTYHVPHEFWKPFNNWRTPAAMYNHALSSGWEAKHFNRPKIGGRLRYK